MLNIDEIMNGVVIDHITAGTGLSLYHLLELEKLSEASVALLQNVRSQKSGKKDIIKIEGDISGLNFDVLGYVDPQISLTFIENGHVARKVRPDQPKRLVNVIKCTNPRCITSLETGCDHIFALTPSASSLDVVTGKDNMFQLCFTDPNQGMGAATYMGTNMAGSKVAVIYRNDDAYSQGIRDTFVAEAANQGLEVVYEGTFTADTATDFSVQLTGAQSAGADVVFLPIYFQPASIILSQANAMGYEPTFFGVDGMDGILTAENFDASLAEGVYLLTPFSADSEDEMTQNFVAEYQDRFGEIPNQFGADAYDAIYTLYQAIQAAGATADMSNEEICDALIEVMPTLAVTGLTSAGSEMTWDENGAVSKDPTAVIIENGTYVTP